MPKKVIRLGDPTEHGSQVIASGSATHAINGVPVAYEGDTTTCGAVLQSTIGTYTQG